MCSACGDPGATLGCFSKNCPNKYHYRCALESGKSSFRFSAQILLFMFTDTASRALRSEVVKCLFYPNAKKKIHLFISLQFLHLNTVMVNGITGTDVSKPGL